MNDATETRTMLLNVGPSHPAMHGVIRLIMELDGEKIVGTEVEIGYLHRAFEKSCEQVGWQQVFPYTDRLNYVSPLINNVGYAMAVEKLMGIEAPERAEYIRTIMSELSRVSDHLTCVGASAMELGAFTVFLYMIKAREYMWELIEQVCGARLTISYARVGGVKADLPGGFAERARAASDKVLAVLSDVDKLVTRNRIFVDRLSGTGVISQELALEYAISGPFLRSTGVDYDVRKDQPYSVYDRLDFDVPVGTKGDNYDRYLCRMEEMRQSLRIVRQCLEQMPKGPVSLDRKKMDAAQMVDEAKIGRTEGFHQVEVAADPTLEGGQRGPHEQVRTESRGVSLPSKEETYGNIEGLMNHFKLIMLGHGVIPPRGEVYHAVEGANGELGFYVVSDGTDYPYRVRVHPPCLPIMQALPDILRGEQMADVVATFGSVNMIAGELDR
ncbi:MAG: NADH-quinone oxidoreductase subunit D [Candidatus Omnitrophica bacterium]|nr:NADH-quinone oxidoreductase subunit D [Candidatus Omnitrophota bacterium]